jgi:hypothetical protein
VSQIFDMFRKELLILTGLAGTIMLAVAVASFWVGHTLRDDADKIALDVLPGLVDAGAAMAQSQENWLNARLLLNSPTPEAQATLIHQIQTNSNEGFWRDYAACVYDPAEAVEYAELLIARTNFTQLRDQYFILIESNNLVAAKGLMEEKLVPAYANYRVASRRLFKFNADIGHRRAATVVRISRWAPLVLAGCGVLVFGLGLVTGVRGALGGLALVSKVRRKDAAEPGSHAAVSQHG